MSQTPQPQPQPQPKPLSTPMPVFKLLADYVAAAASGSRDSLLHLVIAIFSSARAALDHLVKHYQSVPRALTADKLARLRYCIARLKAILYTLRHAPDRFLAPSQLRALTRARAALARIWTQPVDFSPLAPLLTSPTAPVSAPSLPQSKIRNPHSEQSGPSSNPQSSLLLRSPGSALAAVLIHFGRFYGVPAPSTTPPTTTKSSLPSLPSLSSLSSLPSHPQSPIHNPQLINSNYQLTTINQQLSSPSLPSLSALPSHPQSAIHNPQFRPDPG